MGKPSRGSVAGLLGVIDTRRGELTLTLFVNRKRIAIVVGSEQYLHRALSAVGLASPVPALAKHGRRSGVPLVSREPANWNP